MTYVWDVGTMSIMMKKIMCLMILATLGMSGAAHAYVDRGMAVVRIMNKAAGKAQTVTLPVGKHASFEKLDILVRACKQTDPFQPENFHMFIEIEKSGDGKIFSGWMDRNAPGKNPLQNADYDLWLVRCE